MQINKYLEIELKDASLKLFFLKLEELLLKNHMIDVIDMAGID